MPQRLTIVGIRAEGRHGASEGERDSPQTFVVDLELEVDARDDDLRTTGDYRDLLEAVRAAIENESYAIIETIAERVAEVAAGFAGVRVATATVHKPAAAERLRVSDVAAQATRTARGDEGHPEVMM